MLAKGASRRRPRPENGSYWMSYSDMMSALLLMFVLLLFLSFNRYMTLQQSREAEVAASEALVQMKEEALAQAQEDLAAREQELATTRAVLNSREFQLSEQQSQLDLKEQENVTTKQELDQSLAQLILQKKQIEEQEALLALSQQDIEDARAQIAETTKALNDRQILLDAKDAELLIQQLRVTDMETLLSEQATRIDELVGVRARIIEQLRDAFSREGLNVAVDHNSGALTMDSTVFFDTDKTYLRPEGRELLARLLPVYFRTLMLPENAAYVGEIIIEGHTDSAGSYEHNLDLSQRRAQAVVAFCMSDEFDGLTAAEKEQLRAMITANGRSKTQLIYDAYGVEDKAASRRVEIKFRLKDSEMIDSMARILSEINSDEP